MQLSRRVLLGGLLAGLAETGLAQAPAVSPRPAPRPAVTSGAAAAPASARVAAVAVEDLIAAARLGGDVTFAVADARTGLILETRGADRAMPPASTAKAVTALYALEHLGPTFRFVTRLIATGPVAGGIVQGDLVLAGGGDPTLSTDDLAQMAAALAARGVRGVTGRFLVWAGALPFQRDIAEGQPVHVGYNPAVSGLNLNFNRVHFEWRRGQGGYALSMDARSERVVPKVYSARVALADRSVPLFTYAESGGREEWTVARTALGKGGSRWLPVRRPDLYAGDVFQTLARAQGVPLPNPTPVDRLPGGTAVVSHDSADLREVLRDMLRYSTNVTAEAVGMATTQARGGGGGIAASGRAMTEWLRVRAGAGGARFVDHSGLGVETRISAAEMVAAFVRLGPALNLRPILRDIPLRDTKGREIKGHPIRLEAKTGTLNFVSTLAGYMTTPDGTDLVFTIFTGDVARRAAVGPSEAPEGADAWVKRSKRLQQQLIERWAAVYGR